MRANGCYEWYACLFESGEFLEKSVQSSSCWAGMIDQISSVNDEINLLLNRRVDNCLEYLSVDGDLNLVSSADGRPIESYVCVCNVNEREIRL